MKNALTVFKREVSSYFSQPTAYAIIVIFLLLSMALTFSFGRFMQVGDANLEWPFFFWHPWIYMLLAPAVGMRLWSDEQRTGTIELLGTLPLSPWSAIFGKFFASAFVWAVALLLTFPIAITVNYLGEPDNGTMIAGYLGSFLVCCAFLAITMLISACSRDQIVSLIVSVSICVFMVMISYDDFIRVFANILPEGLTEVIVSFGVWDHFRSMMRGLFRLQDAVWFASLIILSLIGTSAVLSAKRS